jgi:hypothetical protein
MPDTGRQEPATAQVPTTSPPQAVTLSQDASTLPVVLVPPVLLVAPPAPLLVLLVAPPAPLLVLLAAVCPVLPTSPLVAV